MRPRFSGVTVVVAVITLCTVLPFLPGRYDPLALPLSMMARVAGLLSLLFVPIGVVWVAAHSRRSPSVRQHACAVAALGVAALVWGAVSLAAFGLGSLSLAVICLAMGASFAPGLRARLARSRTAPPARAPGLCFLLVPVALFLVQRAILEPAVEFSRNLAITNSAPLIADIEQYRAVRGHYPPSLISVNEDYAPGVIGIEKFQYEPNGAAFNLIFEQPAAPLGTQEFVVYNPRGEHTATSHAMDLLQYTPELLERARGYYATHTVPQTHWKYFWFD